MRPWVAVAVAAVAALALAAPSPAQSLAEVAARTKKKAEEEKSGKPAKVYTESDLRGHPAASGSMSQMEGQATAAASPAPGASPAATAAGEKPAKTEDEERAEKATEWRDRLQKAEADVTRISDEVNRAQTALNDISGPLYGGNRAGLITRVEEGKRNLAIAQQNVIDLQEEGRRARYR